MSMSKESIFRDIIEQLEGDPASLDFSPLADRLGYSGFVVAEFDLVDRTILSASSTMAPKWLEHYAAETYWDVDPFIERALNGGQAAYVKCGGLATNKGHSKKTLRLNHELKDAGYSKLFGTGFQTNDANVMRWVSISSSENKEPIDPAVAATFATALSVFFEFENKEKSTPINFPDTEISALTHNTTERERDAVSLLVAGRNIGQISHTMGISETMVHRHLTSCQRKLGAASREQLCVVALKLGIVKV